ncbi:MAG: hypothetical protein ACRESZ_11585 [Methylococcales bacterium]
MTSKRVYNFRGTHGACSQVSELKSRVPKPFEYVPRTALGANLVALRRKAMDGGMPLLTENQIIEEIMRRSGDLSDAEM